MRAKQFFALLLTISLLITAVPTSGISFGGTTSAMGTMLLTENRQIAPGVLWQQIKAQNGITPLALHTLSFNLKDPNIEMQSFSGDKVASRMTVSKAIAAAAATGQNVVAGINGDFFSLATGTPIGLLIKNGELYSSDGTYAQAIGFRADGSVIFDDPRLTFALESEWKNLVIAHINKDQGDYGPYLYTNRFGTTTGSKADSIEVVLSYDGRALAIGQNTPVTVIEVRENVQSTPIGANQIVLSARIGKVGHASLKGLAVGDKFDLSIKDLDNKWNDVTQSVGGRTRLIRDGAIVSGLSATNLNPMSLIGVKTDGTVVALEVDGRQAGYSGGISHKTAASILLELGCVQALELDGGGSSTISLRTPGNAKTGTVNRPSDGSERAVSNGLLLVSKHLPSAVADGTGLLPANAASLLHIYPGKSYLMPGTSLPLQVKSTDASFFGTNVPANIVMTTTGGTIDGTTSVLTAGTVPGAYDIIATNGIATGNASFIVVDQLTSIRPSSASVVLGAGQQVDLAAIGLVDGIPAISKDNLFTWTVEGEVGAVSPEGLFTAGNVEEKSGTIRITYGNISATVSVYVGKSPVTIESFDEPVSWFAEFSKAKSATITRQENSSVARFGDGYMQLNYDFTLDGAEGGVGGIYAGPLVLGGADGKTPAIGGILLDGKPTAVGLWVNGDASGHWLRAKLTDVTGKVVDLNYTTEYRTDTKKGGVDWTGWKYVQAPIPSGLTAPYTLTTPVRLMSTRDAMRNKGTLLIDRMRLIYGINNDDATSPIINEVYPPDGAVINQGSVDLTAVFRDNVGGSGIDPKSVQFLLDGIPQAPVLTESEGVWVLSKSYDETLLSAGYHAAFLTFMDREGNKATTSWSFQVETNTPGIRLDYPTVVAPGNTFTATVMVKNPNTLRTLNLELKYDKNMLEVVDVNTKVKGIQFGLEKWVASGTQVKHAVDTANGIIRYEVKNLNSTLKLEERKAVMVTFKMKKGAVSTGDMVLKNGSMQVLGVKYLQPFSLPRMKVATEDPLVMTVTGMAFGETTRIVVKDKAGKPVSGASIYLPNHGPGAMFTTDANGEVVTQLITGLSVGTEVHFQAVKGTQVSPVLKLSILPERTGT